MRKQKINPLVFLKKGAINMSVFNFLVATKNIKGKEIANAVGVSEQTVSEWIRGKPIPEDHQTTIANMLGVRVQFIGKQLSPIDFGEDFDEETLNSVEREIIKEANSNIEACLPTVTLQPARRADTIVSANLQQTIYRKVSLETLEPYVDQKTFDDISETYGSSGFHCWGTTLFNRSKFLRITAGSTVLFCGDGMAYFSGVITHKIESKRLAEKLWKTKTGKEPFELIYLIQDLNPQEINIKELTKVIGYNKDFIQSFTVLDNEKSTKIFNYYDLQSNLFQPTISKLAFENELTKFSGDLDVNRNQTGRLEQFHLRKHLLNNSPTGVCACCGETMGADLLVCSHIKKRATCTLEEKKDYNVVTLMCTLNGCDKLFELGYIGVGYDGRIVTVDKNSSHIITKDLSRRLAHLKGKNFLSWNANNSKFFQWHYEFHNFPNE